MKVKGWVVALLVTSFFAFYLLRYTSLFKSDTPVPVLAEAFNEKPIGYFDRSDSSAALPQDLQSLCIQIHPGTQAGELTAAFRQLDPKKKLILTVLTGQEDALERLADGKFDDALQALAEAIPRGNRVYIRWNPDMEVPVKRHAWQYQSPADYIRAFRHLAQILKQHRPDAQLLWSPAGYPGTEEYWPGSDVVDAVGISVNGPSEQEATAYPRDPDRITTLRRKLIRTRFMPKPVFIFSSDSLTPDLQRDLKDAAQDLRDNAQWVFQKFEIKEPALRKAGSIPLLGVYDPRQALTGLPSVQVEHLFVDLSNIQSGAFEKDFQAVVNRGHQVIVTVEPWRDLKPRKDSSALRNTIRGVYDEEFLALFATISRTSLPVYVRFAHEMEIPIHRYSWQSQDPVLYIQAFRYFMQLGKDVRNVRKVWGPAGDRGSMEWYPGDDAVDFVSIAIYGLPDKNITDPTKQESFETIFNRKVWRMRFASKPVFITEFGVKGPEDFQSQWMEAAARVLASHKAVWGACYFNLADNPEVWGDIPAPDWGISRATFERFVQVLRENK